METHVHDVNPAGNEALEAIEKQTGPHNSFRAMSHRPEAMGDFVRFYKTVMGTGSVDHRLKEMVYLAVSSVNESDYCAAHHRETALTAGLSGNELEDVAAETDAGFSPKERAALQYARELTRTASTERDTRTAVEGFFRPEQLVELTMVIALANFTNRFNNGLAVPLENERTQTAS